MIRRHCALHAEIRLKISHQKCSRHSFTCNIADDHAEAISTKVEEVVVIATNLASLDARTRVFDCSNRWKSLREEPRLHLLGNFEFLRRAMAEKEEGERRAIKGQIESELIHIESYASFLISNENVDSVNTEIGAAPI